MATRPERPPRPARPRLALQGSLWLAADGREFAGGSRLALLRAVADEGSITQAARAVGMSYKGAWMAIDAMNQAAGAPLVERATGGRGGGSTVLTDHGRRVLERYEQVASAHTHFVGLLDAAAMDLDQDFSLLKVLNVKTSARNQWVGTVAAIRAGAVNDGLEIALPGGARLSATVTRESTDTLGLRLQQTVIAMVKASAVVLATDLGDAQVSARNRLDGTVRRVQPGAVNAEVEIEGPGGLSIVSIVAQAAVDALGLAPGAGVTALVNASDVIVATIA
jgi:molybdate transport system regulatory protein